MMLVGSGIAVLCHRECGDSTRSLGIGAGVVMAGAGFFVFGFALPHP